MIRILIIEDEIPSFEKLLLYSQEYFSNDMQYDWARSVIEGTQFLQKQNYDLILSDIALLDGNAFDIYKKIAIPCPIIFCTAYDNYLIEAFQTNGIAYVLKPYSKEKLEEAFAKYQKLFPKSENENVSSLLMEQLQEIVQQSNTNYKKRFVIKKSNGIFLLPTQEIASITAQGDFCTAITPEGKQHSINQSIGSLQDVLDPKLFFKINRSQYIQLASIQKIENHFKNRLLIYLKGHNKPLMTSTASTAAFRKWLS